jgi:hypothetical protein
MKTMVATTTIMSSKPPSAAILIISSLSGADLVLHTQGPRIDHLSSDTELRIGSHVAEPAHSINTVPTQLSIGRPARVPDQIVAARHGHDESTMRATYSHGHQEDLVSAGELLEGATRLSRPVQMLTLS